MLRSSTVVACAVAGLRRLQVEVKLDLVSVRGSDDVRRDEVKFIPDLQASPGGKGVRDLVNSWVGSFFTVSTQFKRLDNEGTSATTAFHSLSVLLPVTLFRCIFFSIVSN